VVQAIRLANHDMRVIAVAGDGDCYGEGGNHFLHAMRRNVNITLFVHDNQVYGLTKGQASPTTGEGVVTSVQPFGVFSEPLNPVALAVAMDASFVARGSTTDQEQLQALMREAIEYKGFALLDIMQQCVIYNKLNTFQWYKERCYRVGDDHDPTDREASWRLAREFGDRIPTLEERIPGIANSDPLVRQPFKVADVVGELERYY